MHEPPRGLAFLIHRDTVYFAEAPLERLAGEPRSAATELIQGVYELDPGHAHSILRNRIFTNTPLTEMCRGMIKVAAKRAGTFEDEDCAAKGLSGPTTEEFLARIHARVSSQSGDRQIQVSFYGAPESARPGKPVDARLLSPTGELLASAVNLNSTNRTLHAEVLLIQEFFRRNRRPLPAGSRLYVSLKPCKMCAGMIWECAENPAAIEVIYLEDDPGPHARDTVLDAEGNARRRAARERGDQALLKLPVQRKATAEDRARWG